MLDYLILFIYFVCCLLFVLFKNTHVKARILSFVRLSANMNRFEYFVCLFVWLVGFLTSSSTARLYHGRAPRQSVCQFYMLPHMRQSWETMTSVSAGHIILTPTQPVGSGRPQRGSNPGPSHKESRALPIELLRPPRFE